MSVNAVQLRNRPGAGPHLIRAGDLARQSAHGFRNLAGPMAWLGVLTAFTGIALLLMLAPEKPQTILALAVGLIGALCIMRWPIVGTCVAVVLTIMFDVYPSAWVHAPTADLGVFSNLSNRGLPNGVVVSLFELVITLTLVSSLAQRFHRRMPFMRGELFLPLMAFGVMVLIGEVNGVLTGGDFKISLWELRPLFYLAILYVVAVNTVSRPIHIRAILWLTLVCTAIRSVDGIYRYFQLPADMRASVPTILEHDDSLFLVAVFGILVATLIWRAWLPKRFMQVLIGVVPLAAYMMIINHRRAAFMCLAITIVILLPVIWIGLGSSERRRRMAYLVLAGSVLIAAYLSAFWNSEGNIAEPARAIRSIIEPDERDYLSNLYREAENKNLQYMIGLSPYVGIGFGKPIQVVYPMVDLTSTWSLQLYLPHNNLLWLWMRMGIVGFLIFWTMVGAAVLVILSSIRLATRALGPPPEPRRQHHKTNRKRRGGYQPDGPTEQARDYAYFLMLGMLTMSVLVSLLCLAAVDQGLMSSRLMAYTGILLGSLAAGREMYRQGFSRADADADAGAVGAVDQAQEAHIYAHGRRMRIIGRP